MPPPLSTDTVCAGVFYPGPSLQKACDHTDSSILKRPKALQPGDYCCSLQQPGSHRRLCGSRGHQSPFLAVNVRSGQEVYFPLCQLFSQHRGKALHVRLCGPRLGSVAKLAASPTLAPALPHTKTPSRPTQKDHNAGDCLEVLSPGRTGPALPWRHPSTDSNSILLSLDALYSTLCDCYTSDTSVLPTFCPIESGLGYLIGAELVGSRARVTWFTCGRGLCIHKTTVHILQHKQIRYNVTQFHLFNTPCLCYIATTI